MLKSLTIFHPIKHKHMRFVLTIFLTQNKQPKVSSFYKVAFFLRQKEYNEMKASTTQSAFDDYAIHIEVRRCSDE